MPSHPDRVRRNNCPEHDWHLYPGVHKTGPHYYVLDGYECWNCGTVISKNKYDKLKETNAQRS